MFMVLTHIGMSYVCSVIKTFLFGIDAPERANKTLSTEDIIAYTSIFSAALY